MKLVPQIVAAYNDLNAVLVSKLDDAVKGKDTAAEKELNERLVYNDNAYFLLL